MLSYIHGGEVMDSPKLRGILEQIAQREHTTVAAVRKEIMETMAEGQPNQDPAVQAAWAAIPRKGKELTLEEFVAYLVQKSQ